MNTVFGTEEKSPKQVLYMHTLAQRMCVCVCVRVCVSEYAYL